MIHGFSPALKSNVATTSVDASFSKDFLGHFIKVPTKEGLLKHAEIFEEERNDPFIRPLIESPSPALCSLNLNMGGPNTLPTISQALNKKENQSSAVALFKSNFSRLSSQLFSPTKDKVLKVLDRMGSILDQAHRGNLRNANGLGSQSRWEEYNLSKEVGRLILQAHHAYVREQKQAYNGPSAAYMRIYISARLGYTPENLENYVSSLEENSESVKTFKDAWEELQDYVNEGIKLKPLPKEDKRVSSVFTLVYRASLIDPSKVTAGLVSVLQYFFEKEKLDEINQITKENAFRQALKTNLKSVLDEVIMSSIGGGLPPQSPTSFDPLANIDGGVGRANDSLGRVQNTLGTLEKTQTAVLSEVLQKLDKVTLNQNRLEQQFNSAVRQIGLQSNDSTSSLSSAGSIDSAVGGLSRTGSSANLNSPRNQASMSPIITENMPAGQFTRSRSPSPPQEELIAEIKAEIKAEFAAKFDEAEARHAREKAELREEAKKEREALAAQQQKQQEEMFARIAGLFAAQQSKQPN